MSDQQHPDRSPAVEGPQASNAKTAPPVPRRHSELGAAVLTIVLWLLLIDVAVETFMNGAPVRWWIVSVVAAFLSLAAVVSWRGSNRFGWPRRATASFFVLVGLLAWTVWQPDGLTNGAAMLRQPTSVVLSAVSGLAVAAAGLMLVRVSFLPWWGRAAFGLLALYGVAAFVLGIMDGTPYGALFDGGSLWSRLPYWLQGAFVGSLVAVPLAIAAGVFDAFKRLRAADGRGWGFQQSLALALITLVAVSGFTANAGYASGVAAASGGPQLSAQEITKPLDDTYRELSRVLSGQKEGQVRTPQEVALQLEQLFPALEAAAKEIPRDTFDMAAVVQKVGRDPVKLFEWVRDETYFVPYRGLLRGHTGVLMDRLGNSLDRAVLLHAMLDSIGQTVRLATAELTNEQAASLLDKVRPVPTDGVPALARRAADSTEAVLRAYTQEHHIDQGTLRQAMDKLSAEQQRVREAVQNRVTQQTAMIAKAIGIPPRNEAEESATRIQGVKEHWWVEWQKGSTWTAFDPSLADAAPGQTLSTATRTLSPKYFRDLGADRLHSIQLRVVVETWHRGKVSEAAVLTRDLLPAELIGKSIVLRFVPVAWPRDLDLFQEKDPLAKLKETVLAQAEWLPILQIDGQNFSRYTFNDYGDFGDMTLPGYAQAALAGRALVHKVEEAAEDLGNKIGGMLGGPKEKPAAAATPPSRKYLTAVWIDYELHSPGQPARTVRRDILDVLGPATRAISPAIAPAMSEFDRLERGLALMGETDILPVVSRITPKYLDHLVSENLLANGRGLIDLLRSVDQFDLRSLISKASEMTWLPGNLYVLALARWDWSRFQRDVYLDRPNILAHHRRVRADTKGKLWPDEGFDIVANDVAVHSGSSDAFHVRLEQGVLDTTAEVLVAEAICGIVKSKAACGHIENTAELFVRSTGQQIGWSILKHTDDLARRHGELPRDVLSRIDQEVRTGYLVLAPERSVSRAHPMFIGWWRIDPGSGQTLGIGSRGWGQASVEYTLMKATVTGIVVGGAVGYVSCQIEEGTLTLDTLKRCKSDAMCGALLGGLGGLLAAWLAGGSVAVGGTSQLFGRYFAMEGYRAASRLTVGGGAVGGAFGPSICDRLAGQLHAP